MSLRIEKVRPSKEKEENKKKTEEANKGDKNKADFCRLYFSTVKKKVKYRFLPNDLSLTRLNTKEKDFNL